MSVVVRIRGSGSNGNCVASYFIVILRVGLLPSFKRSAQFSIRALRRANDQHPIVAGTGSIGAVVDTINGVEDISSVLAQQLSGLIAGDMIDYQQFVTYFQR